MKHTFLNQRKIFFHRSNTWRLLLRCMGLLLFVFSASISLSAQKLFTGSGSTCTANFNIGMEQTGSLFYDDDVVTGRIEYVACPTDPNKELVKVAVTMFDVAPGDTLTIYEGCGITNTIVARTYGGGASAATALPSSWFLADCDSDDGCLTFVFAPNGDNNKGRGIDLAMSCEDRPTEVTCPVDTTIPGICDLNHTKSVAAIYTIPKPTATCSYEPVIMPEQVAVFKLIFTWLLQTGTISSTVIVKLQLGIGVVLGIGI